MIRPYGRCLVCVLIACGALGATPPVADAQESGSRSPVVGLSLGLGNPYGWLGGAVEAYAFDGRASIRLGAGYPPRSEGLWGFAVWAASMRRYFGSDRHGLAVEASYSLLTYNGLSVNGVLLSETRRYGPGVAAAYRLTGASGLHLDVSLGSGWSVAGSRLRPTVGVGAGYTWRRPPSS